MCRIEGYRVRFLIITNGSHFLPPTTSTSIVRYLAIDGAYGVGQYSIKGMGTRLSGEAGNILPKKIIEMRSLEAMMWK